MRITEDYVSFETAKLLKEKGFDECPLYRYDDCGQFWVQGGYDKTIKWHFPAPTIQMTMKWLREKHNVHIEIRITNHSLSGFIDIPKYYWVLFDASKVKWMGESTLNKPIAFDTPEEAYANAIKYCLEKII